jgi:hypothetical protein
MQQQVQRRSNPSRKGKGINSKYMNDSYTQDLSMLQVQAAQSSVATNHPTGKRGGAV